MQATVQIFAHNAGEMELLFDALARVSKSTSVEVSVTVPAAPEPEAAAPQQPAPVESEQPPASASPLKLVKDEPAVTLQQVKDALQAFAKAKGMPAAQELLQTFGAQRVSNLKPEQYADVLAKVTVGA